MASDAELGAQILRRFQPGELGRYLLFPGDPDRVSTIAKGWDASEEHALERGFRLAHGRYHGREIAALSSGMGGPSLEILLVEAASLGIDTFIRVGTTGSLKGNVRCGELVINEASVRLDGTSMSYARPEFPAAASWEVTSALIAAAERLSHPFHVGIGATTASFFAGQDRPSFDGYLSPETQGLMAELQRLGVLNFEMEAATLFTLARVFGLRAGAVCSVIAERTSGTWDDAGGIERACATASEAVAILSQTTSR